MKTFARVLMAVLMAINSVAGGSSALVACVGIDGLHIEFSSQHSCAGHCEKSSPDEVTLEADPHRHCEDFVFTSPLFKDFSRHAAARSDSGNTLHRRPLPYRDGEFVCRGGMPVAVEYSACASANRAAKPSAAGHLKISAEIKQSETKVSGQLYVKKSVVKFYAHKKIFCGAFAFANFVRRANQI